MKSLGSRFVVAILLLASIAGLEAQALRNTLTFDNQSGESALVKLVGPTAQTVEVPNEEKRTVTVAAGEYYLLARYGADPRRYTYSRGNPFKVEETPTQSAVITITLHKVVGGNYPSRSTSREEFDRAPILAPKTSPDQPATATATEKAPGTPLSTKESQQVPGGGQRVDRFDGKKAYLDTVFHMESGKPIENRGLTFEILDIRYQVPHISGIQLLQGYQNVIVRVKITIRKGNWGEVAWARYPVAIGPAGALSHRKCPV